MTVMRVKISLLYLMLLGIFGITSCSSVNTTVDNIVEVEEMNMILKIKGEPYYGNNFKRNYMGGGNY